MVHGCRNQLIKVFVFATNLLITVCGALLFLLSEWTNVDEDFAKILRNLVYPAKDNGFVEDLAQYQASMWVLCAIGVLLFMVGILGCYGAARESLIMLTLRMIHADNDYADLVIVAEDQWYSRKQETTTMYIYNTCWEIYQDGIPVVFCKEFLPERENCHAEVLFITNNVLVKKVCQNFTLDGEYGSDVAFGDGFHHHDSVVIRILENKQNILKEFDNRSAADVTFVVNGEECKADRMWMGAASPVFKAMLYGQFAEAQLDKIVLEGIESAELFKDFLLAVSPLRIQPNPSNVVALLKLAHQFDVPFLTRNCEDHLLRCYEISTADRILLAGKYGLDSLKMRTMQKLSDDDLQIILKEKGDLCEPGCRFLLDIIADRMKKMQAELQKTQQK